MSEAVYWAIRDIHDDELTASQQNILFVIAASLGTNGFCWHSLTALAKISHHSKSQLIRNLKILVQKGYLIKQHQGGGNVRDTNEYKLSALFFRGVNMTPVKGSAVSKCDPSGVKMTRLGVSKCDPKKEIEDIKEDIRPLAESNGLSEHQKIIDLYHKILPMCPYVRAWPKRRAQLLNARIKEEKERESLTWWKELFEHVGKSKFLTGQANSFIANLEWMLKPSNLLKIVEGNYDDIRP